MKNYDLTIIGSGPGGYVCAIRAAQLGFKTAIIEKYSTLGGTCLNVGCIPSKALLDSSEHYHNAVATFPEHGIDVKSVKVNMPQMIARKDDVVKKTTEGVAYLMKKNNIDVFTGVGSFVSAKELKITDSEGKEELISSKNVVIATGSKPITPAFMNYDKKRVITSTEALGLKKVPKKMIVIGGGVIGLELSSVYARLGCEVEVVEFADRVIAGMDKDCSKELMRSMKKLGVSFNLKHKVTEVKSTASIVTVTAEPVKGGDSVEFKADYCLVAIGRYAYTDGLSLENTQVKTDERGKVLVNDHLETSEPGVYAIGDVVSGAMLAHKAEEEGVFIAESLAGQKPHIDYNLIPGVVYTWPEVAAVGQTEEELKSKGVEYKVGKFPFKALGRARASMDTAGVVKVLADKTTDEVLGVHIVGPRAADMIAQAVALMEYRATAEDMAIMSYAHPTYMEAVKEAALAATAGRERHL